MKFISSIFVLLIFTVHSARPYNTPINYVSNPDFSIPNIGTSSGAVTKAGAWLETSNKLELGYAKKYNSRWPSGQVIELVFSTNSNVYQSIRLDPGFYQLNITWAARQGAPLSLSKWSVYWNDVLVQMIPATDYEIHTQTLIVKAKPGMNKLSLRGESNDTRGTVGANVKFVSLYAQNYIQNGYFETPNTNGGWKIVKSAGSWYSYTDEIKIGLGSLFNPVWKTGQIAELDGTKNSQIYQNVSLPVGKYHLRFNWAARSGVPLTSSAFSVWWNGARLTLITATDYFLHFFTADLDITSEKIYILILKGEGTSDGYGIGVDNVRIWRYV